LGFRENNNVEAMPHPIDATARSEPAPGRAEESPAIPLHAIAEDVFHCLPMGVLFFDRSLYIRHRNPAACSLFPSHATISETLAAGTVEGQYQDWASELRRVLDSGQPQRFDSVLYSESTGEERLLNLFCAPLESGRSGERVGAILVAEDISPRASLERRLAVSERLAAVGKLAARVAHELNNPLDGILRYINLARRVVTKNAETPVEKVTEYLDRARDGLQRMADIISELLEFSRSTPGEPDGGNVNSVLEEAVRTMSEPADRSHVTVTSSSQNDQMPPVRGSRLFQIFCNLIKNAIDAMPDGGRLAITSAMDDGDVVIRFDDTGVGLPDDADKVFEPFFTTKQAGKGTGLGLAICKDYIERLHGTIRAENRPGGGASFEIRIPGQSLATETPDR
jgi:signal transduction histidine kinase